MVICTAIEQSLHLLLSRLRAGSMRIENLRQKDVITADRLRQVGGRGVMITYDIEFSFNWGFSEGEGDESCRMV